MRFGVFVPPFAEFAEPRRVVALSTAAEASGWDGVFLWDHMLAFPGMAVADPWVVMAAMAAATQRIRSGCARDATSEAATMGAQPSDGDT